jgi:hypothetical protein
MSLAHISQIDQPSDDEMELAEELLACNNLESDTDDQHNNNNSINHQTDKHNQNNNGDLGNSHPRQDT